MKLNNRQFPDARIAVSLVFFAAGAIFANWVARIPDVTATLRMSEGQLGLALMVSSIGALVGLLTTSSLIAHFGSKAVSSWGIIVYAIVLGFIGLSTNFIMLSIALFFAGLCNGATDVSMNTQGVEVEKASEKPLMNSFHAFWSLGLFAGALMGSGFVAIGFSFHQHFLTVPILFIVLAMLARRHLLDSAVDQNGMSQPAFQFPPRIVWGLGTIAFASGLSEGIVVDWGALYLVDVIKTSEAVAAFGLAAFSTTMVLMRFTGDAITKRVGVVRMVRISGFSVVVGLALVLLFPTFWMTVIGFSMIGLGIAVPIPLAFSVAGRINELPPGSGIAGVATIGYAAFLVGPPIIGFIAESTSLPLGFALVLVVAATMIYTAGELNVDSKSHLN